MDQGLSRRTVASSGAVRRLPVAALTVLLACGTAAADVTYNVNVTGSPAADFDWDPYRQENEVSCGYNPDNELIKICAYNWYGYADRIQHDAWIAMSTTRDGENWTHQPITGHVGNDYLGFDAAADPTVLTFPGGAFITSIVLDRDGNSKMVAQRLVEMNRETGSPYALEDVQQTIADFNGVNFIDKPDAELIVLAGGSKKEVTITLDEIDDDPESPGFGQKKQVTRLWPEFTLCIAYAVFGGSKENVRTYATCSDEFGATGTFSNPRQITQSVDGGLDQGLTIAAIGDKVLYVTRRFDSGDGDAIIGAIANDRGYRPGKVFEISDICPMDQHTAPSPENPNRVSPRSLDFPWLSATHTHFVLAYVDRPRDAQGNCFSSYSNIGGSRVMVRTSQHGMKWSDAVPVVPFEDQPVHFHLQPNIACARGACNVVYYSTINESIAYEALLDNVAAENYWETNEFVEDFDVFDPQLNQVLRFRRSVDVVANEIRIQANGDPLPLPPIQVSRYQLDFNDLGEAVQIEWNSLGNLIFGGMTQPFHGDYLANTTNFWWKDPVSGEWGPNSAPIGPIDDDINRMRYFAAWTDNRRIRGLVYNDDNYDEGNPPAALPYEIVEAPGMVRNGESDTTNTDGIQDLLAENPDSESGSPKGTQPGAPVTWVRAANPKQRPDRFASAYAHRAEGPADPNPNAPVCQPGIPNFPQFPGFQTNAKNSEIYGATIDTSIRLVSPNVGKNLGNFNSTFGVYLQRGFVMGLDNLSPDDRRLVRLVIAGQPGKEPVPPDVDPEPVVFPDVRASWRQTAIR